MVIDYEGQKYTFDMAEVTVKQAIKIEKHTGMAFADWGEAVAKGADLKAVQAIGWLVLHGGRDVPIEDCDFKLMKLGEAFAAAAAADEAAAKAAEDPTSGAANGAVSPTAPAAAAAG